MTSQDETPDTPTHSRRPQKAPPYEEWLEWRVAALQRRVEELEADNARLREALQSIAEQPALDRVPAPEVVSRLVRIAKAALAREETR